MEYKIPFSGRAHEYHDEEIQTVVDILKSTKKLTQGDYLKDFEQNFSRFIGVKHAFGVNNATSALELAAQLCQFKPGDEIIIPGHTYTSSAYPFVKNGAKIVWSDIDLVTRVVNIDTVKRCFSKRTKAIVVVHLYGYGVEMQKIMDFAKENKLIVIEDAAQALGVEIDGAKAGSFGDFGIFSFHSHKNISTLGEGGMITVRDKKYAEIIPMLRHNGHCSYDNQTEYWKPAMSNVNTAYLNGRNLLPNNFCLGEIESAVGTKLLKRIDKINEDKRKRAIHFIDELKNFEELRFHRVDTKQHNYHLLVAYFSNDKRDAFIDLMSREEKIQCVVQYYPLYRYDLYKNINQHEYHCPNTDFFFDNMVSFPFQHWMSEADFQYLLSSTKKVLTSLT